MRIAHLSDPHLLDLDGVPVRRIATNKRASGWLTLKLHRRAAHRSAIVEAMVDDINAQRAAHVVITGDVTNLALESEFGYARRVFSRLALGARDVTVIPGNHDVYTRGSERSQRFVQFFGEHMTSDLDVGTAHPSGPFPFVRLRKNIAIIGLSTAVARMPLVASGRAGDAQLQAVRDVLEHPEVQRRTPVVLIHHPLVNPPGWIVAATHGLLEARKIRSLLGRGIGHGLVLHGHLHDRAHREFETERGGTLHHIGATSASLVHKRPHRMAGYNVYDLDSAGRLEATHARVWDRASERFVERTIPRRRART
jgi:3',5'-cyclic AMP phosphodiesterase CpdA